MVGEPGREPGLVLHLVDDLETGGGIVLGHQQADGVGADVDGGDAVARGRARGRLAAPDPGRRAGDHAPETAGKASDARDSPPSSA